MDELTLPQNSKHVAIILFSLPYLFPPQTCPSFFRCRCGSNLMILSPPLFAVIPDDEHNVVAKQHLLRYNPCCSLQMFSPTSPHVQRHVQQTSVGWPQARRSPRRRNSQLALIYFAMATVTSYGQCALQCMCSPLCHSYWIPATDYESTKILASGESISGGLVEMVYIIGNDFECYSPQTVGPFHWRLMMLLLKPASIWIIIIPTRIPGSCEIINKI